MFVCSQEVMGMMVVVVMGTMVEGSKGWRSCLCSLATALPTAEHWT